MFSTALEQVTDLMDKRFLKNAFFPTLVFWGLLILVWISGQDDVVATAKAWNEQEISSKTLQIIAFLAWVFFSASLLASQWNTLLRLYEGYWYSFLGKRLRGVGQRWHQKQLVETLSSNKDLSTKQRLIYYNYPSPLQEDADHFMPSRLGNIIKNAELYPRDRYGINSIVVWPRLFDLSPDGFLKTLSSARDALDFMISISSLSVLFALISGGYLLIVRAEWWLFLVCFWGGLLLAWVAYRGSLSSASVFADQIKVGFDLHRNKVLEQMRLPLPAGIKVEKMRWQQVTTFLYLGGEPSWEFETKESSKPAKD